MLMELRSNTILITGGAGGIGYELTKQLTALGNTILITGRDQAKMDRAKAAFPKIHTFRSDVSDPDAIATLYEEVTKQFPELNILTTKAGLHSFTESLRVQLKNTKVKVFDLAPPATQTELLGDFSSEDLKGASVMKVEKMVQVAIKGMQTNR